MSVTICGIPMVPIPHPQSPWLEGVTPVTNLQWAKGVEPFMNEGAQFGILERKGLCGNWEARNLGSFHDLVDTVGHDRVSSFLKSSKIGFLGDMAHPAYFFEWRRMTSPVGFDGERQPAVHMTWAEAKAWTLLQGGLRLLSNDEWTWSAMAGRDFFNFAPWNGNRRGPNGIRLVHEGRTTVDVYDFSYPDGPFGLRHKKGNVAEFVELDDPYDWHDWMNVRIRGGLDEHLCAGAIEEIQTDESYENVGFRVGADPSKVTP